MARWFIDRTPQSGSPSVSLRRLLPEAKFTGCQDWDVSGCSTDSRQVAPGQLFVAIQGPEHDGHAFVAEALHQGAVGVVVERPCREAGRLQVLVPDSRAAHARILHALAGDPSKQLRVLAVAGSRGKGVTACFLRGILESSGTQVGVIGASDWSDGRASLPIGPDFPSAEGLASMLAAMVRQGCGGSIVEFGDDALAGSTISDGLTIEAAVVTSIADRNPDQDDAEARRNRRKACARLARRVAPGGVLIVNADDPDCEMLGGVNLDTRRVTFGIDQQEADVTATVERSDPTSSTFRLKGLDRERLVTIQLGGIDRVRQALAAAATAWAFGIDADSIVNGLRKVSRLPGRFESVDEGQGFEVRIDQARTAEDLAQALATLRSTCPTGRILCVIGAEGQGDREGRRALAEAADAGSDQMVLTSDNPRSEDPDRILDELLGACRNPGRAIVQPDRRRAIETALALAVPGDAVLIAGKGRHAFQILADRVIPFDDRAVASQTLRSRRTELRRTSA